MIDVATLKIKLDLLLADIQLLNTFIHEVGTVQLGDLPLPPTDTLRTMVAKILADQNDILVSITALRNETITYKDQAIAASVAAQASKVAAAASASAAEVSRLAAATSASASEASKVQAAVSASAALASAAAALASEQECVTQAAAALASAVRAEGAAATMEGGVSLLGVKDAVKDLPPIRDKSTIHGNMWFVGLDEAPIKDLYVAFKLPSDPPNRWKIVGTSAYGQEAGNTVIVFTNVSSNGYIVTGKKVRFTSSTVPVMLFGPAPDRKMFALEDETVEWDLGTSKATIDMTSYLLKAGISGPTFGGEWVALFGNNQGGFVDSALSAESTNAVQNKVVDAAIKAIPVITVDSALSGSSENPLQNKVVKAAIEAATLAFGLGGKAIYVTDWNQHLLPGLYYGDNLTLNPPVAGGWFLADIRSPSPIEGERTYTTFDATRYRSLPGVTLFFGAKAGTDLIQWRQKPFDIAGDGSSNGMVAPGNMGSGTPSVIITDLNIAKKTNGKFSMHGATQPGALPFNDWFYLDSEVFDVTGHTYVIIATAASPPGLSYKKASRGDGTESAWLLQSIPPLPANNNANYRLNCRNGSLTWVQV